MSWIESHQSLSRHRKTLRVAAILKVDRYKLIGHLHELWWWGLDNADADGHLMGIGEVEIAAAAGWPDKQSHAFVEALVVAGFLDEDFQCSQGGAGLTLHNWYRYAGKLNEQIDLRRESNRAAQERRRHRLREEKGTRESALTNADSQHDKADNQHPTVPNLTIPDHDPSDHKRRASSRKALAPPPDAVSPSEIRYITPRDIDMWTEREPTLRIAAFVQDYVDWQAAQKTKHRDQVRGFENQLSEQWRRDKFAKLGVNENGTVRTGYGSGNGSRRPGQLPTDAERRAEFAALGIRIDD